MSVWDAANKLQFRLHCVTTKFTIYCLVIHYNHFHTENQKLTTKSERDDLGPSVWPSSSLPNCVCVCLRDWNECELDSLMKMRNNSMKLGIAMKISQKNSVVSQNFEWNAQLCLCSQLLDKAVGRKRTGVMSRTISKSGLE